MVVDMDDANDRAFTEGEPPRGGFRRRHTDGPQHRAAALDRQGQPTVEVTIRRSALVGFLAEESHSWLGQHQQVFMLLDEAVRRPGHATIRIIDDGQ